MMRSFLVILFSFNAMAGGMIGNGGGSGELALVYARQNYSTLVKPCLQNVECGLTVEEKNLLLKIVQGRMPDLVFLTKIELGDKPFFTEKVLGTSIQINKNLLWTAENPGGAFGVADGLALLSSALGEQHLTPLIGATLGSKLNSYLKNKHTRYLPFLGSDNLQLLIFKDFQSDMIVVEDGFDHFFNLDEAIRLQIGCAVSRLMVYDFQWQPSLGGQTQQLILAGRIGWICAGQVKKTTASVNIILNVESKMAETRESLQITSDEPEVILSDVSLF